MNKLIIFLLFTINFAIIAESQPLLQEKDLSGVIASTNLELLNLQSEIEDLKKQQSSTKDLLDKNELSEKIGELEATQREKLKDYLKSSLQFIEETDQKITKKIVVLKNKPVSKENVAMLSKMIILKKEFKKVSNKLSQSLDFLEFDNQEVELRKLSDLISGMNIPCIKDDCTVIIDYDNDQSVRKNNGF